MSMRSGFTLLEVLVTLAVLSIGALAVMQFTSQTQDTMAETRHLEMMCRLATTKMVELEREGFSSSVSRRGDFDDNPGYDWSAEAKQVKDGWYCMELVITQNDNGRSLIVERLFKEPF